MVKTELPSVYKELGVKRIVNAMGGATMLGGSILQPEIQQAMEEANHTFVSMEDLLEKSGKAISDMLGAEAALVTSGCFAALALSAAGVMTGTNREYIHRLPDTTGMKNQFLIQKAMRYHYDRCVTVAGGILLEVGDEQGTTHDQLADAIGPDTAGILYAAHLEPTKGVLTLKETLDIAHNRGVPVLVDAAYQAYPLERLTNLAQSGADSVCVSSKYIGGPNSAGFMCGEKGLVEAATLNGFIAYETPDNRGFEGFGRGFKLDRQEVIATIVALREWFNLDHEERLRIQEQRFEVIAESISGTPHIQVEQGFFKGLPWMSLKITLDEDALGKTAAEVEKSMREGDPSIWIQIGSLDGYDKTILVATQTLHEGEEQVVARRLREVLEG